MIITNGLTKYSSRAKNEVYEVIEHGSNITIRKVATVDEFGEPLTTTEKTFKAYPIKFSPFNNKVIQKASWAENVNVIATLSFKAVELQSLTIEDMKSYTELVINGKVFKITNCEESGLIGDEYLYVHIGGIHAS